MFDFLWPPWTTACEASLLFTISQSLLKFLSIESMMPYNYLIFCCPLLFIPSIFPRIRVFSSELAFHTKWLKYWNFSFSISASNDYPGLVSFRIDRLDLLAIQGTLKSLQHHSSWVLSLYGPTITCTHDCCKTHSFDSMDLCQQMCLLVNMRYSLS